MADKADKGVKRKRHGHESSKPSKKVAIAGDRIIKIALQDSEKWAPIIGMYGLSKQRIRTTTTTALLIYPFTFDLVLTSAVSSAGVAVPSISFQPYTKPRANGPQRPGRSGAIATTEVLLHSSAHPKMDYTVREEDSLQKHYVGVYDPATGKLEVTEARKMEVRAAVREHQATEDQVHQVSWSVDEAVLAANYFTPERSPVPH